MLQLLGTSEEPVSPAFWGPPHGAGSTPPIALQVDGLVLGIRGRDAGDDPTSWAEEGRLFVAADRGPTRGDEPTRPAEGLLRAYLAGGIAGLSAVQGDWSAAIVDRRHGHHDLVLARGGRGTHPIYFARTRSGLVFSSSIAALLADDAVTRHVDAGMLREYLAGRTAGDPAATLLTAVRRIPSGHWLRLDWADGNGRPLPAPVPLRPGEPASRGGSPRRGLQPPAAALPTPAQVLTELPEAVRQLEEPVTGVEQYLAWRAGQPGGPAAPRAAEGRSDPPDAVVGQWLRVRRAQVQGILRSPGFCGRPYWDDLGPAEAFRRACAHPSRSMAPFWRQLNAELWLRLFVDRSRDRLPHPLREGELEELGDPCLRAGIPAVKAHPAHRGRHAAMVGRDGRAYLRLPVRTRNVWPGHDLTEVLDEALDGSGVPLRSGDVVALAEKIVAISQGHVVPLDQVRVRALSRLLSRFTTRTPAGIFLGLPESFELAVREAGLPRILAGTVATALTRPFGIRGVFYRFTGWKVAAIDSPDPDALPPSDTCIKLAPHDPDGVSARLAEHLSRRAGARIEVAVVDVNDIGADVLGASPGVDRRTLVSVLRDNPLGQDRQQTPVGIVRRVVPR